MKRHTPETFWALVKTGAPDECWEWSRFRDRLGYGRVTYHGKMWMAYRLAYVLTHGPIEKPLVLDHLCRNPPCCNPAHLEPVTQGENFRRADPGRHFRQQTHCVNNHPFSGDNLRLGANGRWRYCRACDRLKSARFRNKQKENA
jgi:hypothetical protein